MYASTLRRGLWNPSVVLSNPSRYICRPRLEFCLCQQQPEFVGLRLAQGPRSSGVSVRHQGLTSGCMTPTPARKMLTSALSSSWTESDFNCLADATLDAINAEVERGLEDRYDGEFDVSLSQGVLTLQIGDHGCWVMNKQGPNRQIWWSSPLSGPRRYEWHHDEDEWVHTRSSGKLLEILQMEVLEVSGDGEGGKPDGNAKAK